MNSIICDQTIEEIAFLVRSPSRLRILELLYEDELTLDEIRDRLSVSHSTAQRNLRALIDRNYILENANQGTFSICISGNLTYLQLRDFCEFFESAIALREFCRHFPESFPVSPPQISHLTISTPNVDHPFQPTQFLSELIDGGSDVRLLNPVSNPLYLKQLADRFRDNNAETEVIMTDTTVSRMREWCSVSLSEYNDRSNTTILVTESVPQFGIALVDTTAVLISYGPDRKTHSVLKTDQESTDLSQWIFDRYSAQRDRFDRAIV